MILHLLSAAPHMHAPYALCTHHSPEHYAKPDATISGREQNPTHFNIYAKMTGTASNGKLGIQSGF